MGPLMGKTYYGWYNTFSAESVLHVQGYGQGEASHTSYAKRLAIRPLAVKTKAPLLMRVFTERRTLSGTDANYETDGLSIPARAVFRENDA
jgi:hypothetical protein